VIPESAPSLEDISDALPPYREEVVSVEMDGPLKEAYGDLDRPSRRLCASTVAISR